MSRFGADPRAFFEAVYREPAPWDVGRPQPAMAELLAEYPPDGPVLDLGCGSGDLAIHIAASGIQTIGIDFVEEAIVQADAKRDTLPSEIARHLEFRVADAFHLSRLGQTFGAIVDCGFYHLFDPDDCEQFVEELASALRPGGRYYLHEFAVTFPVPNVPRDITQDELREHFTPEKGWQVLTIRAGEFQNRVAAPVPATVACIEYLESHIRA